MAPEMKHQRAFSIAAPAEAKATSALPGPTPAQTFYASPELRQRMLSMLDKSSLCKMARLEKAITYDVVNLLYEEVDFAHLRSKMSRSNNRRKLACDAVRVINFGDNWMTPPTYSKIFPDEPEWPYPGSRRGPPGIAYSPNLIKGIVPLVRAKCPNLRTLRFNQVTDWTDKHDWRDRWTVNLHQNQGGSIDLSLPFVLKDDKCLQWSSSSIDHTPPQGFTIHVSSQMRLDGLAWYDPDPQPPSNGVGQSCRLLMARLGLLDPSHPDFKAVSPWFHADKTPNLDTLVCDYSYHGGLIRNLVDLLPVCGGRIRHLTVLCTSNSKHTLADVQDLLGGLGTHAPKLQSLRIEMIYTKPDDDGASRPLTADNLPLHLDELHVDAWTEQKGGWDLISLVCLAEWASKSVGPGGKLWIRCKTFDRFSRSFKKPDHPKVLDLSNFAACYRRKVLAYPRLAKMSLWRDLYIYGHQDLEALEADSAGQPIPPILQHVAAAIASLEATTLKTKPETALLELLRNLTTSHAELTENGQAGEKEGGDGDGDGASNGDGTQISLLPASASTDHMRRLIRALVEGDAANETKQSRKPRGKGIPGGKTTTDVCQELARHPGVLELVRSIRRQQTCKAK